MKNQNQLLSARHPSYISEFEYWSKWRSIVDGGDAFVSKYLHKLVDESAQDFLYRKEITPAATFAKVALYEIITSILARMPNVLRNGGSQSYVKACAGLGSGIDGYGASMNQFMVLSILTELLTMRRVGIFVDRPVLAPGASIEDAKKAPPYVYFYPVEDILAWVFSPGSLMPSEVLLKQRVPKTLENSQLVIGEDTQYLHMVNKDKIVNVTTYSYTGDVVSTLILDLPEIPFVLLEINNSVVKDIAGHQIALLNLESSAVSFALSSNFSVYTEQTDMATFMAALRRSSPTVDEDSDADYDEAGQDGDTAAIRIGSTRGRRYMQKGERPGFISPDNSNLAQTEALRTTLKDDIRRLMLLTVANIAARGVASVTALQLSQASANNGLAALGTILEFAERQTAKIWGWYEAEEPATVQYPTDYQILSDVERRTAIDELTKLRDSVPSRAYQEEVTSTIAHLLLGHKLSQTAMEKIISEIKQAPALLSKVDNVVSVVETGIMPREYAAQCLCFPKDAAEKANIEHAERLKRISEAQSKNGSARGNPDGVDDANMEKETSQNPDMQKGMMQ